MRGTAGHGRSRIRSCGSTRGGCALPATRSEDHRSDFRHDLNSGEPAASSRPPYKEMPRPPADSAGHTLARAERPMIFPQPAATEGPCSSCGVPKAPERRSPSGGKPTAAHWTRSCRRSTTARSSPGAQPCCRPSPAPCRKAPSSSVTWPATRAPPGRPARPAARTPPAGPDPGRGHLDDGRHPSRAAGLPGPRAGRPDHGRVMKQATRRKASLA